MANRRMFALSLIDEDAFLSMPLSTQALYFHLSMRADDDGFVNNPKKIVRMTGCNDDEMRLLIARNYVIPFDSGVCVITHWRLHNYLRSDRYKETRYLDEKSELSVSKSGEYEKNGDGIPLGIPTVDRMYDQRSAQVRLGKVRQDEDSQGEESEVRQQTKVIRYCQDATMFLSGKHMDEIFDFLNDGIGADMLMYAVDLTLENGSRAWAYAKAIIAKWRDSGIRTIEAARNEQAAHKAKKKGADDPPPRKLGFDD